MGTRIPAITLAGSIPDAAAAGTRVVAEWVVTNRLPARVAVNVYLRTERAPLVSVACKGGRTQVGRYHASAVVSLEPARAARLAALIGPLEAGLLHVHAVAVTDEDEVEVLLVTRVSPQAEDGPLAAARGQG